MSFWQIIIVPVQRIASTPRAPASRRGSPGSTGSRSGPRCRGRWGEMRIVWTMLPISRLVSDVWLGLDSSYSHSEARESCYSFSSLYKQWRNQVPLPMLLWRDATSHKGLVLKFIMTASSGSTRKVLVAVDISEETDHQYCQHPARC